jgi:signal transduction histidine kinase
MKRVHTKGAVALTAAAVLIPCGAWYLIGTRQLGREATQLEQVARREATSAAERMAAHLAISLEQLNDHETNRPYLHYWREFLSRGESCDDLKVRKSPLARFKRHKLIKAHFQIDEQGKVASPEPWVSMEGLQFSDPTAGVPIDAMARRSPVHASLMPTAALGGGASSSGANSSNASSSSANGGNDRPRAEETAQVLPFRWHTGAYEGTPALMAVRQVITTGETFVQGFMVDSAGLAHWVFEREFPADLAPGEPRGDTEARVPIVGVSWRLKVDPTPRLERAQTRAALLSRQFHQSYSGGALGALLAGACLVMLIRRSERMAEERSRFAAAAAHELRTPLAGIRLHGEMLALALGNPAKVTEYAGRITDEAERLTRLVSNVFNYTQVDQKQLHIQRAPADVGQVVREALALVQPIVERAGADLSVRVEGGLPPVELDRDALHQMVRNVVDNAEKYSRQSADRRIEVTVSSSDPAWVDIAVRDHGPGVPLHLRQRIFAPFARHGREDQPSGLGLGLSVVRTLALAHGGSVFVEEPSGGGARFVVRLPAQPPATPEA